MKLKSLILGSVAAAGLSTAGYAADLGVLTSLDVCDSLGISGLTISSSDNCLQITGGVNYEFIWGDWNAEGQVARVSPEGTVRVPVGNSVGGFEQDWESKIEAWVQLVGTSSTDFGRASATIRLKSVERLQTWNEGRSVRNPVPGAAPFATSVTTVNGDTTAGFEIDQAFVQVGDTTTIMAGKKGSIADLGDDAPFNSFLGLFNSQEIDGRGIGVDADFDGLGGASIQVVSEVADGLKVGVGLENLNGDFDLVGSFGPGTIAAPETQGTLVGVVSYAGEGITAHVTGAALGILDGTVESWFVHAGATGSFDAFKVRGAVSYWDDYKFISDLNVLSGILTAEGSFDLFTVSAGVEAINVEGPGVDYTNYGVGGQVGVAIAEGISINLGARYFNDDLRDLDTTQVAVQVVAALTETIKATGEIGGYFGDGVSAGNINGIDYIGDDNVYYGAAELGWTPGGNLTSSIRGEIYSTDAYKVTFKAAKEFK